MSLSLLRKIIIVYWRDNLESHSQLQTIKHIIQNGVFILRCIFPLGPLSQSFNSAVQKNYHFLFLITKSFLVYFVACSKKLCHHLRNLAYLGLKISMLDINSSNDSQPCLFSLRKRVLLGEFLIKSFQRGVLFREVSRV